MREREEEPRRAVWMESMAGILHVMTKGEEDDPSTGLTLFLSSAVRAAITCARRTKTRIGSCRCRFTIIRIILIIIITITVTIITITITRIACKTRTDPTRRRRRSLRGEQRCESRWSKNKENEA